MYQIHHATGQGLTLLDTVRLQEGWYPRVDGQSRQVYISCGSHRTVSVVSWQGKRLTTHPTLACVGLCRSVAVVSPGTLCACDYDSSSVTVVSVTDDTVTAKLRKTVRDKKPYGTAVLPESVLVWYSSRRLVVYENGLSNPGSVVTWPTGLQSVEGMSSDGVSKFFVCDGVSNAVFMLDASGKQCGKKIKIDTDSTKVWDCTVVGTKLWVGCGNGDIVIMSPL